MSLVPIAFASVGFRLAVPLIGEMLVGHPNQFHRRFQTRFVADDRRNVSGFRRPSVRPRFTFRQHLLLVVVRQPDIAVAVAMDMHEHRSTDKERVFVDSGILSFGDTGQFEDPVS
jgi:hypothetical protein